MVHEHERNIQPSQPDSDGRQPVGRQLSQHIIAMADDAYLSGHPEWQTIVADARRAAEVSAITAVLLDAVRDGVEMLPIDDDFVAARREENRRWFPALVLRGPEGAVRGGPEARREAQRAAATRQPHPGREDLRSPLRLLWRLKFRRMR
jgi:hypothetical protein